MSIANQTLGVRDTPRTKIDPDVVPEGFMVVARKTVKISGETYAPGEWIPGGERMTRLGARVRSRHVSIVKVPESS